MRPSRPLRLAAAIALSAAVTISCQSSGTGSSALAHGWQASDPVASGPDANGVALSPDEKTAIAVLYEYQDAHRKRDLQRLARVWSMDPFQQVLMARVFRDEPQMSLTVQPVDLRRNASDLMVDFDQTSPRLGSAGGLPLRARLLRRRGGEWAIYGIEPRPRGDVRGGAPADPAAAESPAAAIREFQAAFGARDLERLATVWLMGEGDRASVEDLFARRADTAFGVEVLGMEVDGERAIVDFEQIPQRTGTDRLRARIEQAPDGRWVIATIDPR
jgi:hypothetical protein